MNCSIFCMRWIKRAGVTHESCVNRLKARHCLGYRIDNRQTPSYCHQQLRYFTLVRRSAQLIICCLLWIKMQLTVYSFGGKFAKIMCFQFNSNFMLIMNFFAWIDRLFFKWLTNVMIFYKCSRIRSSRWIEQHQPLSETEYLTFSLFKWH